MRWESRSTISWVSGRKGCVCGHRRLSPGRLHSRPALGTEGRACDARSHGRPAPLQCSPREPEPEPLWSAAVPPVAHAAPSPPHRPPPPKTRARDGPAQGRQAPAGSPRAPGVADLQPQTLLGSAAACRPCGMPSWSCSAHCRRCRPTPSCPSWTCCCWPPPTSPTSPAVCRTTMRRQETPDWAPCEATATCTQLR